MPTNVNAIIVKCVNISQLEIFFFLYPTPVQLRGC